MSNFQTSKTIARLCQYVGSAAAVLCGIALFFVFFAGSDEPFRRLQNISLYAGGAFGGIILVMIGQLVEAQITVAINSTNILNLLQARETPASVATTRTQTMVSTSPTAAPAQNPSKTSPPPEGGRFLRMYKGAELHKHADGISVNGEGRYSSILEAEKQAQKLAENQG